MAPIILPIPVNSSDGQICFFFKLSTILCFSKYRNNLRDCEFSFPFVNNTPPIILPASRYPIRYDDLSRARLNERSPKDAGVLTQIRQGCWLMMYVLSSRDRNSCYKKKIFKFRQPVSLLYPALFILPLGYHLFPSRVALR